MGKTIAIYPRRIRASGLESTTDGYVWTLSVFCVMLEEKSVSYPAFPDLYFSLVMTDKSSTSRGKSLLRSTIYYMLHGTWKSTNFVSVFENILKTSSCCLGNFLKTRAKCILKVNLSNARALSCHLFGLNEMDWQHRIGGYACAIVYITAGAAPLL